MPTLSVLPNNAGELALGLEQVGDDVHLVDNVGNTLITVKNGGGHPEFAFYALGNAAVGGDAHYETRTLPNGLSVVLIHG